MTRLLLAVCMLALMLPGTSTARTWYILPDGTGDAPTIQAGIDSAADGDTVLLSQDVFSGIGNRDVDFSNRAVVVTSEGNDPTQCTIDCESTEGEPHCGFYIHRGEDSGSVLSSVTITGGDPAVKCVVDMVAPTRPLISNCVFVANPGDAIVCSSGGLVPEDASPTIIDCVFADNGCALHCSTTSHPLVVGCVFERNRGRAVICSGGIFCTGTIRNCRFIDNQSGGAFIEGDVYFEDCLFQGNSAGVTGMGGASFGGQFSHCIFWGNSAGWGGAIFAMGLPAAQIEGCTFVENSAYVTGAAVYTTGCLGYISHSIVAFNLGPEPVGCGSDPTCQMSLYYCDVFGNHNCDYCGCISSQYGVNDNFSRDPLFCDTQNGDLRLGDCSPCLDWHGGGLVGALGRGCFCDPTSTVPTTWGAIKSMYR